MVAENHGVEAELVERGRGRLRSVSNADLPGRGKVKRTLEAAHVFDAVNRKHVPAVFFLVQPSDSRYSSLPHSEMLYYTFPIGYVTICYSSLPHSEMLY